MSTGLTRTLAIVFAHLGLSLAATLFLSDPKQTDRAQLKVFGPLGLSGAAFFRGAFVSGAFLYALLVALRYFGLRGPDIQRQVIAAVGFSVAVSLLLAADSYSAPAARTSERPQSFWALVYALGTERRAVSLAAVLSLAAIVTGVVYLVRSFITVEYQGTGIQIRLPGQTVHYIPVYPQISWQPTGIRLNEGETVTIELFGRVSPGALGEIDSLQARLTAWHKTVERFTTATQFADSLKATREYQSLTPTTTWEYTGPEGYPKDWYSPNGKKPFLKQNPLYKKDYFFQVDPDLTVRGLPHNVVLGFIQADGALPPKEGGGLRPGYDYSNQSDVDQLLYLSASPGRYPIPVTARHAGMLWIVINDTDTVRWDNAGMFFLKLTRNAWF